MKGTQTDGQAQRTKTRQNKRNKERHMVKREGEEGGGSEGVHHTNGETQHKQEIMCKWFFRCVSYGRKRVPTPTVRRDLLRGEQ